MIALTLQEISEGKPISQQLRIKHKKSRSAQKKVSLSGRVEKLLKHYSLGAAGIEKRVKDFSFVAAGMGALALMTPAANADIVYSGPVNASVTAGHPFTLSLLGDPVLRIQNNLHLFGSWVQTSSGGYFNTTATTHAVHVNRLGNALLFFGTGGAPIIRGKAISGSVAGPVTSQLLATSVFGKFKGGTDDLLGFQFGTSHNRHNGWLGIGINATASLNANVVDYAYEACKGDSISAGATSGGATCTPPLSPTPEPNMLALLALGAAGWVAFRRRKAA